MMKKKRTNAARKNPNQAYYLNNLVNDLELPPLVKKQEKNSFLNRIRPSGSGLKALEDIIKEKTKQATRKAVEETKNTAYKAITTSKEAIKQKNGYWKNKIDLITDPLLLFLTTNTAGIIMTDYAINYLKETMTNPKLAVGGTYIISAGAAAFINKKNYDFGKKIIKKNLERIKEKKPKKALSWLRTGALISLLAITTPQVENAINNMSYDAKIVINKTRQIFNHEEKKEPESYQIVASNDYKTMIVKTGKLKGHKLSGLYTGLTGLKGLVGGEARINPDSLLLGVWLEKVMMPGATKAVHEAFEQRVKPLLIKKKTKMSLEEYITEANKSIKEVKENIAWEKVKKKEYLKKDELELVKKISESIRGKDLIAYAMTELLPSRNGKLNKEVFDFVLRNYGREFLELFPSLHDNLASIGPYQLTSHTIYASGKEKRGASKINYCLDEKQRIPDSVIKLEGNHHHKAAYMLAIHNLSILVRNLNIKQKKTLKKIWSDDDNIIQYVATAHHNPGRALFSAKKWLNAEGKKDYVNYCTPRIKYYARKTINNRKAL